MDIDENEKLSNGMTIQEAVDHDIRLWEEHQKEMGWDDVEPDYVTSAYVDSKCSRLESRLRAEVERARADLMRWVVVTLMASTLLGVLIAKL